ncbi:BQ5605_C009g05748 [Microbotryum silenes-dioicae]|uniref:BQ5605_C009g05748 protein n=1 Tax=Microbotryum silenes-dioicae TaxID=796604 RepID=A0A2X0N7S3_9BASI|nr:BQ5605_C009g05748 [Microbotryum silenes-dioicae]
MAAPQYTPSSEIIHLVHTFSDTLDALPPALTRSVSDLKELDAVLSGQSLPSCVARRACAAPTGDHLLCEANNVFLGSLNLITTKLQKLLTMMITPPPPSSSAVAAGNGNDPAACTPYDRLRLLREVTEDARVFRLGGEDKIRVATSTCETIATHQNHLATLSTLLLEFLPALMLPTLPAPSAPHGYPQSNTADTAIQRRQMFHLPPERHPGQGSTSRMSAAMGMARDLYEATSSSRNTTLGNGSAAGARTLSTLAPSASNSAAAGASGAAGGGGGGGGGSHKKPRAQNANGTAHGEKEASKHPNQYTKKRIAQAHQTAQANAIGVHSLTAQGGVIASAPAVNAQAGVYAHSASFGGMTAVEAVKEKRRLAGTSANTGVDYAQNGGGLYPEEHAMPQSISPRVGGKRKGEEGYGARKKSKKTVEASPDPTPRTLPTATTTTTSASAPTTTTKTARRAATSAISAIKDSAIDPFGMNAQEAAATTQQASMNKLQEATDLGDDDETDKTLYCLCQRPSFGEMIACDGPTCPHEWFHLDCLKMSSAPKGSWFCDYCRAEKEKKKGGRR